MARRHTFEVPEYYNGPTRRPGVMCSGTETANEYIWDMMDGTWPTTAEWLAWVRRRDGRKRYFGKWGWRYPCRPIIGAHRIPWTTRKVRKLPQ